MKRPRLDLGLDASRATLNETECARIGAVLAAARRARGLNLQDVGASLLLAPTQVSGLESVRADAFYSAEFYATALRKYAVLMGVDPTTTDRVLVRPAAPTPTPAFKRGRRSIGVSLPTVPRPSKRVMLGAGVLVTAVAGGLLVAAVLERSSSKPAPATNDASVPPAMPAEPAAPVALPPPPAQPVRPDTVISMDESAPPSMVPVSTSAVRSAGHVRVGQRTWVFVRFATGATLQRTLGGGEELILKDVPTYIAVGNAEDASVEIAGQPLDTSLFTVNGQLRVGASQLERLVALR